MPPIPAAVGGVAVEVDRFDPGRLLGNRRGVAPTALIPGDVAIPCQVSDPLWCSLLGVDLLVYAISKSVL